MTEWIFFGATVLVSATGFLISRELSRVSDELKHLRQDVFRLSVDLAKLEERIDSILQRIFDRTIDSMRSLSLQGAYNPLPNFDFEGKGFFCIFEAFAIIGW